MKANKRRNKKGGRFVPGPIRFEKPGTGEREGSPADFSGYMLGAGVPWAHLSTPTRKTDTAGRF
jgi:hypothetical protein